MYEVAFLYCFSSLTWRQPTYSSVRNRHAGQNKRVGGKILEKD